MFFSLKNEQAPYLIFMIFQHQNHLHIQSLLEFRVLARLLSEMVGGLMLFSDNLLDFHAKILPLPVGLVREKAAEILNNFVIYHHQSNFYQQNNSNLPFGIFSIFLFALSSTASTGLIISSFFVASFILDSKFVFANLLNSGVVIKFLASGISISISVGFVC